MPRLIAATAVALACGLTAGIGSVPEPAHQAAATRVSSAAPIDRHALVSRHNPVLHRLDPDSPLSVGNGEFAFTADVTGLQTFAEAYDATVPLGTLSQWGWHTSPNPNGWSIDGFPFTEFNSHGRKVGYADIPGGAQTPEIQWLRGNPHRLHLGRIAFDLKARDGRDATPTDLTGAAQTLDLWNGELVSQFSLDGQAVDVETVCHPSADRLAVRVRSRLVRSGRLGIRLSFPYGSGQMTATDWTRPDAHETSVIRSGPRDVELARRLDGDRYTVRATWAPAGRIMRTGHHEFRIRPETRSDTFEFVATFSPTQQTRLGLDPIFEKTFVETRDAARGHWNRFWREGGAVDLSGSRDPRWRELERRIVLSQYLTAIQCAGRTPPQESGLTFNSWEGKFHLEMHWWHAAHFALWNRLQLLEKSLGFYRDILPRAKAAATRQGYRGARWPKMTDPSGAESPSSVGPFLIWQQPHPIFYAELVYRARPTRETLERYGDVVFESAAFMASYAAWDDRLGHYVLGPPLQCAQEAFPKGETINCTFELAYWRWGIDTAQVWRQRMGLARDARWDDVLARLSPLPAADGMYLFAGSAADTYSNVGYRRDHPSVTAALGVLPGPGVNRETMKRTVDWIWNHWTWPDTWGWDYPMLAMTAARLGDTGRAVDALLLDTPKNVYRLNGHNYQRPGLAVYLPGNGALLYAVAMMAAGWDGCPDVAAPGFPRDGSWVVRYEKLSKAP